VPVCLLRVEKPDSDSSAGRRDFRLSFAYSEWVPRLEKNTSASALRRELSYRNAGRTVEWAAEQSYSAIPNIVYGETEDGRHGNFLPAVYRRILMRADWKGRLGKVYTGSRFIPRRGDRIRRELECANSSDALLMNIFCYPGTLRRRPLCSLLAIEPGLDPVFGVRSSIPLKTGARDRSEMDMRLGNLFIEAKLTEGDFQTARLDLIHRCRDLEAVFAVEFLPAHPRCIGRVRPRCLVCRVLRPTPPGSDRRLFRNIIRRGECRAPLPPECGHVAGTCPDAAGQGTTLSSRKVRYRTLLMPAFSAESTAGGW
jgi:hypothetical protein